MDFASIWVILKLVGLASQRLSSPSLGSLAVLTSLGSALARTSPNCNCLPYSALADGNLAEAAGQLGKMVEHLS